MADFAETVIGERSAAKEGPKRGGAKGCILELGGSGGGEGTALEKSVSRKGGGDIFHGGGGSLASLLNGWGRRLQEELFPNSN